MINFKVFGIEFVVSVGFVGVITLMQYLDKTGLIIPTYFAVLFHELGHLIFMKLFKKAPKKISLRVGAASIEGDFTSLGFKDFIIYLGGPAFNFILSGGFYLAFVLADNPHLLKNSLVMLAVGLFNLLPSVGLDGGSMLLCIINRLMPRKKAQLILKIISFVTAAAIIAFGLQAIFIKSNPSPIIMGVYLFVVTLLKKS